MLNKLRVVAMLIYTSWIIIKFILFVLSKRWSIFWSNVTSVSRVMLTLLHNWSFKKNPFSPFVRNAACSIIWALNLMSISPLCIQTKCSIERHTAELISNSPTWASFLCHGLLNPLVTETLGRFDVKRPDCYRCTRPPERQNVITRDYVMGDHTIVQGVIYWRPNGLPSSQTREVQKLLNFGEGTFGTVLDSGDGLATFRYTEAKGHLIDSTAPRGVLIWTRIALTMPFVFRFKSNLKHFQCSKLERLISYASCSFVWELNVVLW